MADGGESIGSPSMRCARGSQNTYKPKRIPARILWPALGFPAVISPGDSSKSDDASTCVVGVIMSNRRKITSKEAADHLRFVPWEQRRTRCLPSGTANGFTEDEIDVRSGGDESPKNPYGIVVTEGFNRDQFGLQLYFGYDTNFKNGFSVCLSDYVRKKYESWGYYYLHEVRASRAASSRLGPGQYNLFWINAESTDTEDNISDEMALLIKKFAMPRRTDLVNSLTDRFVDDETLEVDSRKKDDYLSFLLKEYEYDFDVLHPPYDQGGGPQDDPKRRTEVLHPLFVKPAVPHLQIGHITDLHVDVRADVYEYNAKRAGTGADISAVDDGREVREADLKKESAGIEVDFNNWNKIVTQLYRQAKQGCDVLLLTGDLIDYGRGHEGLKRDAQGMLSADLGDDGKYHVDRNWFLFYYVLASGNSYQKPTYTTLGNHDWRINPYTPFAIAGAPSPRSLINNYLQYKPDLHAATETEDEWMEAEKKAERRMDKRLNAILMNAHGPGAEKAFAYRLKADDLLSLALEEPEGFFTQVRAILANSPTLNIKGLPTETTIESVAWYLLLINPFLDYAFHLPGGYEVLMLDWAEYETLLFPLVVHGQQWYFLPWEAPDAANPGPKARECLTCLQKRMVEDFVAKPGVAKVLGIHMPPIGPYPEWLDDYLYAGRVEHSEHDNMTHYRTIYPDGTSKDWDLFYAVRPPDGPFGQAADYNTLEKNREWLITEIRKDDAHVRLVLSGHIHRNGLFVVYVPEGDPQHSALVGKMLIKMGTPSSTGGVRPPAVMRLPGGEHGPLYVNTTSAGPRGHSYTLRDHKPGTRKALYVDSGYSVVVLSKDGTIQKVEFRSTKT
jgi:hypothetical protein